MGIVQKTKAAMLTEELVEATQIKPITGKKLTPDERYTKKVSSLIQLLAPMTVIVSPTGAEPLYTINDKINREQVEDWIMDLTKKHFKL